MHREQEKLGSAAVSLWASVLAYAGMGLASYGAVGFALLSLVGAAAMVWKASYRDGLEHAAKEAASA
jgi:hypothetical protein